MNVFRLWNKIKQRFERKPSILWSQVAAIDPRLADINGKSLASIIILHGHLSEQRFVLVVGSSQTRQINKLRRHTPDDNLFNEMTKLIEPMIWSSRVDVPMWLICKPETS